MTQAKQLRQVAADAKWRHIDAVSRQKRDNATSRERSLLRQVAAMGALVMELRGLLANAKLCGGTPSAPATVLGSAQ